MPNEKEVELLPKTYFHLLFKAYTEIINNQKQNSASFEFDCPYRDLFYEMCDEDEKVKNIAREIIKDESRHGCCIYTSAECAKFVVIPEKLINFVNSYLDSIIGAENLTLPPKAKQSRLDCARIFPYKRQIQVFKIIIANIFVEYVNSFDFDYLMLTKYGGDGNSVHKRFCIDELLLILQRERLIDKIEVRLEKDYRDKDYNEKLAQLPFYKLTRIKKINYNNGFWFDLINNTIGYKQTKTWNLFLKNGNPVAKTHLLHIFIRYIEKPLSDEDLIKELAEQGIKKGSAKIRSLVSDALSLTASIDSVKIFEITRKRRNKVWFYSLTSKNKNN